MNKEKLEKQLGILENVAEKLVNGCLTSGNIAHDGKTKGYTIQNVVGNIRRILQEEDKPSDFEEIVRGLWNELNTGHTYSVIDSYNIFYGVCLDIANWQKEKMEKNVIAEQKCTCVQVMHRLVGGSWNLACPIDKLGLGSGDMVKVKVEKI